VPSQLRLSLSRFRFAFAGAAFILLFWLSALANTFIAFGPVTYTRQRGRPVAVTNTFSVVNPNAKYTVRVESNRVDEDHDQDSDENDPQGRARILINGKEILDFDDFANLEEHGKGRKDHDDTPLVVEKSVQLLGKNQISVEVHGRVGTSVTVTIIGVDNGQGPSISASINPAPDNFNWNNTNVVVTFTCTAGSSPIKSCTAPVTVSTEAANQVITGTAVDQGGKTASTSVTINLDKTAPLIAPVAAPPPNAANWNKTSVTVSFNCSDALSGVASCSGPVTLATEGANQKATGTVVDKANNSASTSDTVNIDETPPSIVATANPPANAAGWNNTSVTVNFACSDALSGVAACASPVTFTKEGFGQIATGNAADVAGNANSTTAKVSIDETPPTITAAATPAANAAGWNNTNVSVAFTCADALSGVAFCPPVNLVSTEGASENIPGTATDKAGNSASTSVTLKIDKTPPSVTASLTPQPTSFGWNNTSVTVNFACSDALSGVASCASPLTFTKEGDGQVATGNTTDVAGNTNSTTATVRIDETPPMITAAGSPAANAAGWNNSDVTVSFTCIDALSGVATCPAQSVISTEGLNQSTSGTATDKAGNNATTSFSVKLDKTPPTVTATQAPPANAFGWNNTSVTVSFICADALSGVATCASPLVLTKEGAAQPATGTSTDVAGNTGSTTLPVNIDETAPAITASAFPPANAAGWNNTDVTVSFSCSDALSGVASCAAPAVISSEGTNLGTSGSATDKAGNSASTTLNGINIDKTPPTITASISPIPDANGVVQSTLAVVTFSCADVLSGVVVCPTGVRVDTAGPQNITATATDAAGNSATVNANFTLQFPADPLTITATQSPASNAAGWTNSPVTVSFQCAGGVAPVVCPGPQTVSADGNNQIVVGTATDAKGASASTTLSVKLDQTAPTVTITSPQANALLRTAGTLIKGTISDTLSGPATANCNGTPAIITGQSFTCNLTLGPGVNNISIQATDVAGNTTSTSTSFTFKKPPQVLIATPTASSLFSQSPINVTGTVEDPGAQVSVNGIAAPVSGNSFLATVPLREGVNTITAVAQNSDATTSTASVEISLDTTPPHVAIYSPVDNSITTDASITVTGMVNDIVVGTVNPQQATVTVNGVAAQVGNRSFTAANIPLSVGPNIIQAVGVDRAGNQATTSITVTRLATGRAAVKIFSGNNQSGPIGTALAQPLVAQLINAAGQPVPNTPVVFRVIAQDGTVSSSPGPGLPDIAVNTDAQGLASVSFTMGSHSGAGNNLIEASSAGVQATAVFSASATATGASLINVDSGNNQSGATGQALPLPFVAVVTDSGHNRIPNVPVTFSVIRGNGTLDGGQPSITVNSDGDGRVQTMLTLGPAQGINNNVVEATFQGNAAFPVAFSATARDSGPASDTAISGVVLDNSSHPIPGVTMRLFQLHQGPSGNLPQQIGTPVLTNAQGQFSIKPAPVGVFKLMADGGTVQQEGTYPWPTLEYDLVTVSGQNNTVGSPIYLPKLNLNNKVCVSETTGGTLTLPQAPGFSLTIAPGSATFPGGSRSGCVSVTPVNMDKVPMAPGFGQQPRFIVTIQPVGTTFNPPAAITIPNVDGLAPRAVTEMYSYDHDLASFVSIGTATVSADGSVIKSDPGVGVIKAGWHCGGNPNTTGTAATCPDCQKCDGNNCVADPGQDGAQVKEDKCKVCKNGTPTKIDVSNTETEISLSYAVPDEATKQLNDDLEELKDFGIDASFHLLTITGKLKEKDCCEPETGKGKESEGSVTGDFGGFSVEVHLWPPLGPIPHFDLKITVVGLASLEAKGEIKGGWFAKLEGKVAGQVGRKKKECDKNPKNREGCFFANLKTQITVGTSFKLEGSGSVTYDCIFCDKTTIAVEVSFALGDFSWDLTISEISFNDPDCDTGLKGGLFEPGDGKFRIGAKFSGSITQSDGIKRKVEFSKDLLGCTINRETLHNPSQICKFFP
jgi:hypothetical protein